jgi:hypothetical protein
MSDPLWRPETFILDSLLGDGSNPLTYNVLPGSVAVITDFKGSINGDGINVMTSSVGVVTAALGRANFFIDQRIDLTLQVIATFAYWIPVFPGGSIEARCSGASIAAEFQCIVAGRLYALTQL